MNNGGSFILGGIVAMFLTIIVMTTISNSNVNDAYCDGKIHQYRNDMNHFIKNHDAKTSYDYVNTSTTDYELVEIKDDLMLKLSKQIIK